MANIGARRLEKAEDVPTEGGRPRRFGMIATWNSHPIMPIALLPPSDWHGSFAHEAVEPDIMAFEPLIGGEEIGDDRRAGLGDARDVAAEGGH